MLNPKGFNKRNLEENPYNNVSKKEYALIEFKY